MSNFLIKDQGPGSVVADNLYEVRFGVGSFVLGVLAGGLLAALAGRRAMPGADAGAPEGWSSTSPPAAARAWRPRTPSRVSGGA